jgi:uncharacterized membrane protein
MNKLLTAATIAALALLPAGCGNKSPEGGQPGTHDTFTISAPSSTGSTTTAPAITQGTPRTIELTVKADSAFSGKKVDLKAEAPAGLRAEVNPAHLELAAGQEKKVQLVVHAEKAAPAGEATIKVTGTPEKGNPTTDNVKVKVEANNPNGDTKNSFSIDLPNHILSTVKTVKREGSETVELTLKGNSGFNGKKVALKADHDPKIKVELKPDHADLGANQEAKVQMVVSPAKDAPTGEQTIRVTATPETGTPVSREVKVKVE